MQLDQMDATPMNRSLIPLLECIETDVGGVRCKGSLTFKDKLVCDRCHTVYRCVKGVPILNPDIGDNDAWFERMYDGRDRDEQLKTTYLLSERQLFAEFATEKKLTGPCLEIGCGVCLFAEFAPQYIGMEYSLQALFAGGVDRFTRICGDARQIPFKDASIQCLLTFNTLEHVPQVNKAFEEMDRVLQTGGYLFLKPAWHCTRYVTELVHVLPLKELSLRQKAIRASLPVIKSRAYKLVTKLPWRLLRRLRVRQNKPLAWTRLTPYHGKNWVADADATAGLDSHEAIMYYTTRGYSCLSHPTIRMQLLAGHDVVVLQKH